MSKIFRKITSITMAGVMATSLAMSVNADTKVCPPHYAGNSVNTGKVQEISAGTHQHVYYVDANGKEHTKTCWITVEVYQYETRCLICKELLDSFRSGVTRHSVS